MPPCTARMERLLTLLSWQEDILVSVRQSSILWSTTVSPVEGLCVHRRGLVPASSALAWRSPGRSSWIMILILLRSLKSLMMNVTTLVLTPTIV